MIIFKPDWISHVEDRKAGSKLGKSCVYTLHVHPDGTRLATGGLDTAIRIWNMEPIIDPEAEKDENCDRLLCTMKLHNGAVMCVRWSNHGKYLASGSDSDNVIIIWELEPDSNAVIKTTFGSNDKNVESWKTRKMLRGHDSDVQDLAWSKDDRYLASCGVDGYVIVWDGYTFEQVAKINQDGGFVKGITWDPVGKYLASQSDGKVMKIWRTSDWSLEKEVKEPFVNAPGTTLFRRLSWSPTGAHIVTSNAVNGVHCIAAIVGRDDWSSNISLVGHKLPIEVAVYNPKLFYMTEDLAEDPERIPENLVSVCALGGQDRGVSIWVTKFCRPVYVAADIFKSNVYDLAWTPDGQTLFACSQDGTVACLQFNEELAYPAPDDEMLKELSKYEYGHLQELLPDSAVQLELEEQYEASAKPVPTKRATDATKTTVSTPSPMHIDSSESTQPVPTTQTNGTAYPPPSASRPVGTELTSSSGATATIQEQKVTIGKGGKRRIQPIMIQRIEPASPTQGVSSKAQSPARPSNTAATAQHAPAVEHTVVYAAPAFNLPPSGIQTTVTGNKRPVETDTDGDTVMDTGVDTEQELSRRRPVWMDAAVLPPSVSQSQLKLGPPQVKSILVSKFDGNTQMECSNDRGNGDSRYNKLTVSNKASTLWSDILPAAIVLATKSKEFYAVACEDASIHVYSLAGRRMLAPIVLESIPILLQSRDAWVFCLTTSGLIYTWDVLKQKSCLNAVSVAPVLRVAQIPTHTTEAGPTIKDVRILKSGTPIIITNYHQAFVYHEAMKAWTRISDAWYIMSEFWSSASCDAKPDENPLGWLSSAVRHSDDAGLTYGSLSLISKTDKESVGTISTSHIEIQLAVAAMLNTPAEYKDWMLHYARQLAREGAVSKVQELCRWLMGPPFVPEQQWEPTILETLSKKEMLQEILPIFASNRQLQTILCEITSFNQA